MSTAKWLASQLPKHTEVSSATVAAPNLIIIKRKRGDEIRVGVLNDKKVELSSLQAFQGDQPDVIATIPKNAAFSKSAMEFGKEHMIALGGVGDLYSALNLEIPRQYRNSNVGYVQRSLSQHTRVAGFERLDSHRYLVRRQNFPDVTVLVVDDYEITADVAREAISRFDAFDALVTSNPYGRVTSGAASIEHSTGLPIWTWNEFYKQLHKPWSKRKSQL